MSNARPLLVIPGDYPPQLQGSPHLERLKQHGEVILYTDRPGTIEEKVRRAQDAVCLLNTRGGVKWPAEALRQLPKLKMISVCGIGTDAIDLSAAHEQGLVVSNIPGRTAAIVAEHALALLLATARKGWYQTNELKQGRWTGRDLIYLGGKTLGLIGAGSIAAQMARLGRAIGMEVIAWTFNPSPDRARSLGVDFVSLDEVLRRSDAISIHVKLTEQTRGMIGAPELQKMKRGALLINTARGAIVDMTALVAALQRGHLEGAGLDVFDIEPLPSDHPILACEQVVLSPHNADQTPEGMDLLNAGVVENAIAFLEGRPQNRVV